MLKFLFFWIPKIHLLGKLCQPMALQAGEGHNTQSSVTTELCSQSYLQYGWKFQLSWNVTYCLILVTWEPLPRTSSQSTEEDLWTLYILPWEIFLENLENSGDFSPGGQKTWSVAWKSLKELRWESSDLTLLHQETWYSITSWSRVLQYSQGCCYCYCCFFLVTKE